MAKRLDDTDALCYQLKLQMTSVKKEKIIQEQEKLMEEK